LLKRANAEANTFSSGQFERGRQADNILDDKSPIEGIPVSLNILEPMFAKISLVTDKIEHILGSI
jgi:hypothetical protein